MTDQLPRGIRLTVTVYLRSDSAEISTMVELTNLDRTASDWPKLIEAVIASFPSDVPDDWRPMTHGEIDDFLLGRSHG